MSVEVERATLPCQVCGAGVSELRRGRCWGCYMRWTESRPVGRGAACTVCFEKRRDQLRLVELHKRSVPICHGCASRLGRLDEIPPTVDGIRKALRRERRDGERRADSHDHRVFPRERRVGDRRGPPRGTSAAFAAAASGEEGSQTSELAHADLDDVVLEIQEAELEEVEQTFVRKADR